MLKIVTTVASGSRPAKSMMYDVADGYRELVTSNLSPAMAEFISRFDAKEYPHLLKSYWRYFK